MQNTRRNPKWTFRGLRSQRQPPLPAPPDPVFILLTIRKAIYLFHLERDLVVVTSLERSLAFLPPAAPPHACASPCPPHWAVSMACPHVGTGVFLWVP